MPENYITKHGNVIETFVTGAKRDSSKGKLRFDLIGLWFLKRLAGLLARGAEHYGEDNWKQGQPLKRTYESFLRHAYQIPEDETEDHFAAAAFNLMSMVHVIEEVRAGRLPKELMNLGIYADEAANTKAAPVLVSYELIDQLILQVLMDNKGKNMTSEQIKSKVAPSLDTNIFNTRLVNLWRSDAVQGVQDAQDGSWRYGIPADVVPEDDESNEWENTYESEGDEDESSDDREGGWDYDTPWPDESDYVSDSGSGE